MSTNFPTNLDTFTNPSATDEVGVAIGGRTHSQFHSDENDAIEALQAKVGINGSAVTTSHDYKLSEVTGADKAVSKAGSQTITNKTIDGNNNTLTVLAPTQLSGLVPMANGGLGVALVDPNADRILFWDDSAGQYQYLTVGSGLAISGTTITASGTVLNKILTANEDLTAGQTVGISNNISGDKVSRANRFNQAITSNASNTGTLTPSNPNHSCPIGGDKFAFIVEQTSDDGLYVAVGSVNTNTLTTSLGTAVAVTTDIASTATICKLDTDKFIVLYQEDASSTIIKYRIGTVSGTAITLGSAATFATAGSAFTSLSSDYLSTDKAVMFYGCSPTHTDSRVIVFTTSGTTVSATGTPASIGTSIDNDVSVPRIKKTDTDTFILVTASGYAQAGTCIGGTTITFGSNTQFSSSTAGTTYGNNVAVLASGLVVISFELTSDAVEYIAGTLSGTTLSFGTPVAGSTSSFPIYSDSSSSFLATNTSGTISTRRYTVSGTAITLDKTVILGMQNYQNFIPMDNSYYVLIATATTTVNINVQGMSNNFLGIAQATVSKGQTVSVLYSGEDTNQTGLVAGGIYEPDGTGSLSLVSSTSTSFVAGKQPKLKAINSTTILI